LSKNGEPFTFILMAKPNILALSGSIRSNSVNNVILDCIKNAYSSSLSVTIYDQLAELPYFNPDLTDAQHLPPAVGNFISSIEQADAVLLCTPEYVFSLPGVLKNAIEWTVATTVLQDKPTAMIVASLAGQKAFESLDLVLTTVGAKMTTKTKLLIGGAFGKLNKDTNTLDENTLAALRTLIDGLCELIGPD